MNIHLHMCTQMRWMSDVTLVLQVLLSLLPVLILLIVWTAVDPNTARAETFNQTGVGLHAEYEEASILPACKVDAESNLYYVMRKPWIWTILRLSHANLGCMR